MRVVLVLVRRLGCGLLAVGEDVEEAILHASATEPVIRDSRFEIRLYLTVRYRVQRFARTW